MPFATLLHTRQADTDVVGPRRSAMYPGGGSSVVQCYLKQQDVSDNFISASACGRTLSSVSTAKVSSSAECCALCQKDATCTSWVHVTANDVRELSPTAPSLSQDKSHAHTCAHICVKTHHAIIHTCTPTPSSIRSTI